MFRLTSKSIIFVILCLFIVLALGACGQTGVAISGSQSAQSSETPVSPIVVEKLVYVPVTVTPGSPSESVPPSSGACVPVLAQTPVPTSCVNASVAVTSVPRPQTCVIKYPQPILAGPTTGFSYWCLKSSLVLSWSFSGTLAPNEWFLVESAKTDHPNEWFGINEWVKETTVTLNPEKYGNGECSAPWWQNVGVYQWRVRVVKGDQTTHTVQCDMAPASQPWTINYGYAGGGCAPSGCP